MVWAYPSETPRRPSIPRQWIRNFQSPRRTLTEITARTLYLKPTRNPSEFCQIDRSKPRRHTEGYSSCKETGYRANMLDMKDDMHGDRRHIPLRNDRNPCLPSQSEQKGVQDDAWTYWLDNEQLIRAGRQRQPVAFWALSVRPTFADLRRHSVRHDTEKKWISHHIDWWRTMGLK